MSKNENDLNLESPIEVSTQTDDQVVVDSNNVDSNNVDSNNVDPNNVDPNNVDPQKDSDKEKKHTGRNVILAIIAIIIIIILLLRGCSGGHNVVPVPSSSSSSSSALKIEGEELDVPEDKQKIIDELNRQVQAGMLEISMNTKPVFQDGLSEGNLLIVNSPNNTNYMMVEIIEDSSNKVIYKSGAIEVGKQIKNDKLDVNLAAGTYNCTAYFHAINKDTMEDVGKAGAKIQITIANSSGTTESLES